MVICANCGKEVKVVCSNCWKCFDCKDEYCIDHMKKTINGHIHSSSKVKKK